MTAICSFTHLLDHAPLQDRILEIDTTAATPGSSNAIMENPMASSSSWTAPATVALACVLAAYYVRSSAQDRRMRQSLPTPPSTLPILGNTLDLMKYQLPRLHDWLTEQCLANNGKPWLLQALGAPPLVVLSSVEAFEDVLKTQFEIFDKGERMRNIFADFAGDNMVAVDGEPWRYQRRKLSHLFTMRAFRESITMTIHKYVGVLGTVLDAAASAASDNTDTPFDFGNAVHRMAFDIFAEVGFGLQTNTLAGGTDTAFIDALAATGEVIEHRFHQPDFMWQLKRLLRLGDEKRLAEAVAVLNHEIYAIIYENLRRKNDPAYAATAAPRTTKDVISLFLECQDGDDGDTDNASKADKSANSHTQDHPHIDTKFLRDIGIGILAAGKESTALTLSWLIIELNRHPHVADAIRLELRSKLPQLFTDRAFVPTLDDVETLVYLEAALRESLRLHPVVPLNAKEANRDTTLSDGTFIAKGTRVYIPSYALARMPHVWGDDACAYKPERWLEVDAVTGKRKLIHVPATKFVAFHAGPRICLGMRFALFELKAALAFVLSKFELTTAKDAHDFTYHIASLLAVEGPILVRVKRVAP